MKTARFILSLLGLGAPTLGLGFAEPPNQGSEQALSEVRSRSSGDYPPEKPNDPPGRNEKVRTDKNRSGEKTGDSLVTGTGAEASALKAPGELPSSRGQGNRARSLREHSAGNRASLGQTNGASRNASVPDQLRLIPSAFAAAGGFIGNTIEGQRGHAARSPYPGPITVPRLSLLRNRGPAPAIISGTTVPRAKYATAVNGKEMKQRP